MRRFTTPTQKLKIVGANLTGMNVYVTYLQVPQPSMMACERNATQPVKFTVTDPDVTYDVDTDTTIIEVSLSQLQTGVLLAGVAAQVQVNWVDVGGSRNATKIKTFNVTQNLIDRELAYGS